MIAGRLIEKTKENFNELNLKLESQLVVEPSFSGVGKKRDWNVTPSQFALNTTNPIRAIVEHLNVEPNPNKAFIPLSVGKLSLITPFLLNAEKIKSNYLIACGRIIL